MYEAVDRDRIGKKIRDLRCGMNMSAEELARKIGTSTSAVNMYECGQRLPRDEVKIRIAELFGIRVEAIFFPEK